MKARTAKAMCWEHGTRPHLVDGTEDHIFDFGLCSRCLIDFLPDAQQRREFVRRHYVVTLETPPMLYTILWWTPDTPTPLQRLVSRTTEVAEDELVAVAQLAGLASLKGDLHDSDGHFAGRVWPDGTLVLDGRP